MRTRATQQILVDSAIHNPRGFVRFPTRGPQPARFQRHDGVLALTVGAAGRQVVLGPGGVLVGAPGTLRRLTHVDLSKAITGPRAARSPIATARLLATLVARGVPVVVGAVPAAIGAVLHPDVVAALERATATDLAEPFIREALALRQRRAVFRRHIERPSQSVSVLAATRRPHHVEHVASTVAAQQHVDAELVLVTHGFALTRGETRQVQRLARVPVTVRTADANDVLGDVLNIALEAASGDVVTKVDDDDFYGPHHIEDLLHSLSWSGAVLVGAVDEFTYLSALDLTVRQHRPPRHEIRRKRVPGPSMTVRHSDLVALGGWAAIASHVDRELNDAVHRAGGTAHCTHGLGYLRCRHGYRHIWAAPDTQFLRTSVERWPGLVPPAEVRVDAAPHRFASLSNHVPTTRDMNSGWERNPIEA